MIKRWKGERDSRDSSKYGEVTTKEQQEHSDSDYEKALQETCDCSKTFQGGKTVKNLSQPEEWWLVVHSSQYLLCILIKERKNRAKVQKLQRQKWCHEKIYAIAINVVIIIRTNIQYEHRHCQEGKYILIYTQVNRKQWVMELIYSSWQQV